jgi:hypothetical protein
VIVDGMLQRVLLPLSTVGTQQVNVDTYTTSVPFAQGSERLEARIESRHTPAATDKG